MRDMTCHFQDILLAEAGILRSLHRCICIRAMAVMSIQLKGQSNGGLCPRIAGLTILSSVQICITYADHFTDRRVCRHTIATAVFIPNCNGDLLTNLWA